MTTYPMIRRTTRSPLSWLPQILAALAGGVALFVFFNIVLLMVFNLRYLGRVYPGVSVAGISLSGLKPDAAAALLAQKLTYVESGKIVLRGHDASGEQVWIYRPTDLGMSLDAQNSAQAAYSLGRSGGLFRRLGEQLSAWHSGEDVSPLLSYDESVAQRYVQDIATLIDHPTVEASFTVSGREVLALPGQVGRRVDVPATLAALRTQLSSLTDGLVSIVIEETPPEILDASQQADLARQILSAPLLLHLPDEIGGDIGPWALPPEQLAQMLRVERIQATEGAHFQVLLDPTALNTYLSALLPDINRYPSNARFTFNDETHALEVIEPAVIGRFLDIEASTQSINEQVLKGQHSATLTVQSSKPQIGDDATAEQLGVTELVSSYTSYFRGSTTERLQNIELAAANFHGLLVAPGAVFSMAEVMGAVSLDTGYAEASIIFGGRTIKGVGGGVCQVSTTLFRTVFFGGFPIMERYPHAYRVGYYEQTRTGADSDMAGLDATVFVPLVDFKFQNDTPYWLLMETYFNPTARSLTWKFYSTSDGRTVEWETTGPQNTVEPPDPVYEENPELPKGKIKQVDWAAQGADVTVTRTVYRDGVVLYQGTFTTHYLPWGDVYEYGPGTQLPTDKPPKFRIRNPRGWEWIFIPVI